jgi:hypothetical protein
VGIKRGKENSTERKETPVGEKNAKVQLRTRSVEEKTTTELKCNRRKKREDAKGDK